MPVVAVGGLIGGHGATAKDEAGRALEREAFQITKAEMVGHRGRVVVPAQPPRFERNRILSVRSPLSEKLDWVNFPGLGRS